MQRVTGSTHGASGSLAHRGPGTASLLGYAPSMEATVDEKMSPASIRAFWAKGMTNTEIARHYGITKQAVSDMVARYNLRKNDPRKMAVLAFPWRVREEHKGASPNKRLREHAVYYFAGERGLSNLQLKRLYGFYLHLRDNNLVVEYDPDYTGEPGSYERAPGKSGIGGWRWCPREERDDDLIIRFNQHAVPMDEETLKVWRFPTELPKVRW